MDFLAHLSPQGSEVYEMVSRKVKIVENAPICRVHDIFGWYQNTSRTLTLCTDRILSKENARYYINETLFHEAAHVAQACRHAMREIAPFGMSPAMRLASNREKDLARSVKMSGKNIAAIEREAYWLEDKPGAVKHVLIKYCF